MTSGDARQALEWSHRNQPEPPPTCVQEIVHLYDGVHPIPLEITASSHVLSLIDGFWSGLAKIISKPVKTKAKSSKWKGKLSINSKRHKMCSYRLIISTCLMHRSRRPPETRSENRFCG
eukprot:TRINITY_DN11509_c1_g1_i1.p1 TRINITY_DN11509_c1_g1~~TRINITY_DN11509_c1_g1_i1.p1  ORF type:complete len:119 (+),score=17.59 TRINITY_DN11509_c1_g1_i1:226-582(+)